MKQPADSKQKDSTAAAGVTRSRRLRVWAIVITILAAVVIGVSYRSALSPDRIRASAESALVEMIGGQIEIDHAELNPFTGALTIEGFRWSTVEVAGPASELAAADSIRLRLDRGQLMVGAIVPLSVDVDRPMVSLTEDAATGRVNWFAHRWPALEHERVDEPLEVPAVRITAGRYRTAVMSDGGLEPVQMVSFAGGIHVNEEQPDKLDVDFYESSEHEPLDRGIHVSAQIDSGTGRIGGQIEGLRFVDRYRDMLPESVRALWRDLDPQGELPSITFVADPEMGPHAEVAVEGVSFNLPRLTDDEQRVRMEQMTGRFRFSDRGIEIVGDVTGVVEGGAHTLNGSYNGFGPDAPFRLAMKTAEFELPEEPTFMYALPKQVQAAFGMFAPSGRARVTIALWRNEPGGEMTYQGTATVLGGKGRLDRFAYPLHNCRGIVKFNEQEVRILNLTGDTSGGGTATITGRAWPPGDAPAIDVVVTAVDLPFDKVLYEAFQDGHRQAVEMFFDTEQYERLKDAGHYVSFAEYNANELAAADLRHRLADLDDDDPSRAALQEKLALVHRKLETPAFEMGGRGDVIVHITRDEGPEARSKARTELDITEANAVFKHLPYPIRATGGRITVEPSGTKTVDGRTVDVPPKVVFDGIEATGLHGGLAQLRGSVELTGQDAAIGIRPDVQVVVVGLPVDDLLFDALPDGRGQTLKKLKLTGEIDVNGKVFADDEGRPEAAMLVEMTDGQANPGDGSLAVTDLDARLITSLKKARLVRATAKHPEGAITASGSFDFSDPNNAKRELAGSVTNLLFEKIPFGAVSDLARVNTAWQEFLTRHQAKGRFDADLSLSDTGGDAAHRTVTVRPESVGFVNEGRSVELTNVTGTMVVTEEGVTLDKLRGSIDRGVIEANGTIGFGEPRRADVQLNASGTAVTESLKSVLPPVLDNLLTQLKIDGAYDMKISRLTVTPDADDGELHTDLRGMVQLKRGSCTLGVEIAEMDGSLDIAASKRAGEDWPKLSIGLVGRSLVINGRRITDLRGHLKSATDRRCLLVPDLRGRMYGGAVGGSGLVELDTSRYQMRLMMSGVELGAFAAATPKDNNARPESDIAVPRADAEDPDAPRPLSGKLSAAIDLEGSWKKANSVRGRGNIQVTDGVMYDLPLSVGALQVVNLALPVNRAFDRAEIAYLFKDQAMVFERIGLHSSVEVDHNQYVTNLSLKGRGTMALDTQALDITLTSTNPAGLNLGPLSDLIDGFKDQLVTIRVGGTVEAPQTRVEQLSALSGAWNDVFGSDDPN